MEAAVFWANVGFSIAVFFWWRNYQARFRPKPAAAPAVQSAPKFPDIRDFAGTARRRQRIKRIWSRRPDSRSVAILERLFADTTESSALRLDCAALLFPHGRTQAERIAVTIVASRHEDSWLIAKLLALLGSRGGVHCVTPILAALRSDQLQIALAAEGALRTLATDRSGRPELRETVVHGLALSIRNSRKPWNYGRQLQILIDIESARLPFPPSEETIGILIKVMRQESLDNPYAIKTAALAAEALGELGAESALPELERLVHVDCDLLRYKVVTALGKLGTRESIPEIGYLAAKDQIWRIKRRAIDSAIAISQREPPPFPTLPR